MSWPELEDAMSDDIGREFDEAVTHIPTIKLPNARPTTDPDRPAYATKGVFEWLYSQVALTKGQDLNRVQPAAFHSQRECKLSIDKRHWTRIPKQGDIVVLMDRGNIEFEIGDVQPDGQGRMVLYMNRRGVSIK